jgi:hypothetical protein
MRGTLVQLLQKASHCLHYLLRLYLTYWHCMKRSYFTIIVSVLHVLLLVRHAKASKMRNANYRDPHTRMLLFCFMHSCMHASPRSFTVVHTREFLLYSSPACMQARHAIVYAFTERCLLFSFKSCQHWPAGYTCQQLCPACIVQPLTRVRGGSRGRLPRDPRTCQQMSAGWTRNPGVWTRP